MVINVVKTCYNLLNLYEYNLNFTLLTMEGQVQSKEKSKKHIYFFDSFLTILFLV